MNRYQKTNAIRQSLSLNQPSIGSWIQIPHSSIAEILGDAGYDWVAIDLEHGSISLDQIPDLCRALELGGTLPLARVASNSAKDCKRVLDAGVGGIIVPSVDEAGVLERLRDACRWPPAGLRGVGFSRANLFGKNFREYAKESQAPLLVAQIESSRAVDNLESIASVDGLDAVFVGPYDLSASMGLAGKFDDPSFINAIDRVLEVCRELGMPAGIHVIEPNMSELRERIDVGYQFIAYSIDSVMLQVSSERPNL